MTRTLLSLLSIAADFVSDLRREHRIETLRDELNLHALWREVGKLGVRIDALEERKAGRFKR